MAPQHHRCSWSRRRLTELCLADGALAGFGAGIGALLYELGREFPTWHAAQLDPDNAVVLVLPDHLSTAPAISTQPLLPDVLPRAQGLEVRPLDEDAIRALGIGLGEDTAMIRRPELAVHAIEIHDDCAFRFVSRHPAALEQAIAGILALHGGYAGAPGTAVLAPRLLDLLRAGGPLRLRSRRDPARIEILRRIPAGWVRWLRIWTRVGEMAAAPGGWTYRDR